MNWLGDWAKRIEITIDNTNIDANLSHFPLPIFLGTSVGRSSNDVSMIFDEVGTHYKKIAVTKDDGQTQVYVEVEKWDADGKEAVLWVSKSDLTLTSSSTTTLYIYYDLSKPDNVSYVGALGSRSEVWDSGFKMVQHLSAVTDEMWAKSASNPIWGPNATFNSCVVLNGGTYHLYYGKDVGAGTAIHHATSSDGINFTDDTANNPVLEKGSSGEWDAYRVRVPNVWIENGTWYMLYTGDADSSHAKTGLATSSDGVNWTKDSNNPVLSPSETWEGDRAELWGIIKVGPTYYGWYNDMESSSRDLGLATSTDLVNWTKDSNNPIFSNGRFCPSPFKYNGDYYLIVTHYTSGSDYAEMELYRDSSPTFYASSRKLIRIAFQYGSAGEWDDLDLDGPWVLTHNIYRDTFPNNELWCYYGGVDNANRDRKNGVTIETDLDAALAPTKHFDSSSSNNDAATTSVTTQGSAAGKIDGADEFDGVDDYISVAQSGLQITGDAITLEAWAKPTGEPNDFPHLLGAGSDGKHWQIWWNAADNEWDCRLTINETQHSIIDTFVGTLNDWNYVVVVYNGSDIKIYVDGQEIKSNADPSGNLDGIDSDLWIGNNPYLSPREFQGIIDEVRISDTPRNADWIKASYYAQKDNLLTFGSEKCMLHMWLGFNW